MNDPTAEQILAQTIRDELDIRLKAWRQERDQLLQAQARISVLDGLIAIAERQDLTSLAVAPPAPAPDPEL